MTEEQELATNYSADCYEMWNTGPGNSIGHCAAFLADRATATGMRVYGVFNDALIWADPGDSMDIVGDHWDSEYQKRGSVHWSEDRRRERFGRPFQFGDHLALLVKKDARAPRNLLQHIEELEREGDRLATKKADDVAELVVSAREAHDGCSGLLGALEDKGLLTPAMSIVAERLARLQRALEAWEEK